ncbi:MAG: histidine kinase [Flavobacterium sp.]|nr:MAG: histidine kinase [Flavobacterium sp.]
MVYVNMYLLVPRFLFKAKYLTYIISLVLLILSTYLVMRYVVTNYFEQYRIVERRVFSSVFREMLATTNLLTILVFSSTSIKLFQQWARDTQRINELEKSSMQLELKELKNQINPHFLFNMLNNVNVLVRKDPEKASMTILKLSDFLRYQLYDNNQDSVLLLSEIQFLKDFMELEKIRRDEFTFSLAIENKSENEDLVSQLVLPPNLFITFIENAIKHSVDLDNSSEVNILFQIYDTELIFISSNTKPSEPIQDCEKGGLGLVNVKRRLELLYDKNFDLKIEDTERNYTATLTLPI